MSRRVTHDGEGTLQVRFPFDRALVDRIKGLPDRRWNPAGKFWAVPDAGVVALVELLHPEGFRFDRATRRLYRSLEQNGMLDNTWLVLTSDHGEMFERGIKGNSVPVLYQPIMHIPLMIFPPGGQNRVDIKKPTQANDVLPTLMHITGGRPPAWSDGQALPGINAAPSYTEPQISSIQVDRIQNGVIKKAVATWIEDDYKLIWTFGYEPISQGEQILELYNLAADPQELENLYPGKKRIADELFAKLKSKFDTLERSYQT